jgi:DNA-binding transcriptional LysR family regulator
VEYPSIQAAADAHGITRQAMSKRLRQKEQAQ